MLRIQEIYGLENASYTLVDIFHISFLAHCSIYFIFYIAHSGRVTDLKFIEEQEWLVSVSRDKSLKFYCTKTGRKLGSYEAQAWCMAVEYPCIH